MDLGTGGSASNKRNSGRHVTGHLSNEDYIKELQAEIDRLRSESGKGSKYRRQQR